MRRCFLTALLPGAIFLLAVAPSTGDDRPPLAAPEVDPTRAVTGRPEPSFFFSGIPGGVVGGIAAHRIDPDEELRAGRFAWQLDPVEPELALSQRATPRDVDGTWTSVAGLSHSIVRIEKRPDGLYSVEYSSGGCFGSWKLMRIARYVDGELSLDFPVREYPSADFQRFFVIRVGGSEHLVPSGQVASYLSLRSKEAPAEALRAYAAFLPRREER